MALSKKLKERLRVAVRTHKEFDELVELLDAELATKDAVMALTEIADPSTATAEDCANKINEVIAALQS